MNKGFLITFEGGEGCGKSTQIKLFTEFLKKNKFRFVVSREPGGTPVCEKIREVILNSGIEISSKAEFLLFSSARAQHVEEVVKPSLEQGKVVILDRFYDSSFAYQGYAGNLEVKDLEEITKFAIDGCVPDLTIIFDISYEDGFKRKNADEKLKDLDRIESKGESYHNKVRAGYLQIAHDNPDRVVVVDATKTKEKIFEEVVDVFLERFNLKIQNLRKNLNKSFESKIDK